MISARETGFVPIWPSEPVARARRPGQPRHRRLHRERAITGWLEAAAEHLASDALDAGVPLLAVLPPRRPRRRRAAAPDGLAGLTGSASGVGADAVLATAPASLL